jgi:hypothetical protein
MATIRTFQEIEDQIKLLGKFAEADIEGLEPEAIDLYLRQLGVYMASASQLNAEAIYRFREASMSEITKQIAKYTGEVMPASIAKEYLNSALKDFEYLKNLTEAVRWSLEKRHAACITLISKYKEERKISNFQKNA